MKSRAELLKSWIKGKEEISTLEQLAGSERARVAEKLGITPDALGKRLETIKTHCIRYGWYMSEVKKLKKLSPYIVGLLAPSKPDLDDLEDL